MSLLQDAKYGIRVLVKDRWFALFAILALALGIAVNNTVFTLVNAVLIRGLPFEDGNRVVWVGTRDAQKRDGPLSVMDFEDWRSRVKSFEGLSMWFSYPFNLTDADHEPERYPGVYVSENLFTLIRQQPILGRDFSPDDGRDGAPPVLIISHRVWTNRYGSDRGVLGRVVRLQGFQPTIIGVMPPDLHFPSDADLWVPIVHYPDLRTQERNARNFSALGRLAAGVTMQGAEAELSGIAGALAQQYPATNKDISAFVMSFSERQNGGPIRLIFLTLTRTCCSRALPTGRVRSACAWRSAPRVGASCGSCWSRACCCRSWPESSAACCRFSASVCSTWPRRTSASLPGFTSRWTGRSLLIWQPSVSARA
jgi:hypothetical protein